MSSILGILDRRDGPAHHIGFMEIYALRADQDDNPSIPLARPREIPWRAALVLLRKTLAVAATCYLGACQPGLVVGEWKCAETRTKAGSAPSLTDPISVPWSTGFENQFCDYTQVAGYCYESLIASHRVVTSPVHSGHFAAAFTVLAVTDAGASSQVRCVRQGVLPAEAYYGAWYYIPKSATNAVNWNLFHFRGGEPSSQHGLWDVSLVNGPTGKLSLRVYDFLGGRIGDSPPVPIGSWFHIVFYLKRAKDKSGEVALYQDGSKVVDFTNLITDDTDWGQWYVGNYASALIAPDSTLYVDDVTISATP
jgi:hypothetical protein